MKVCSARITATDPTYWSMPLSEDSDTSPLDRKCAECGHPIYAHCRLLDAACLECLREP